MRRIILVNNEKCTGCGICELICSASKEGVFNRKLSRIRLVHIEPILDLAIACRLCEKPACVKSCPRKALFQRNNDNVIIIDEDKCNGCCWCLEACDFGAITVPPNKHYVVVCDLCAGQPRCVEWCPTEALQWKPPEASADDSRLNVVKKRF